MNAAGVTISGSANVTFFAGHTVDLTTGFHATAGSAATTFHAWVDTAPSNVSVLPSSGSGLSQPFTATVSNPPGYGNVSDLYLLFSTSPSILQWACYIRYNRSSNYLYLAANDAQAWSSGFAPGSSGTAQNSTCTISGAGSSYSASGNQLSVTVNVSFLQSVSAVSRNVYLIAYDSLGVHSSWQQMGTWTIPGTQVYYVTTAASPAGAGTISPGSGSYGSGTQVTFLATAASGYQFSSWSGSATGTTNPVTVTISGATTLTANFTATAQYQLITTVSPASQGTITPSCPTGCVYSGGTQVTITATAASGYQFTGFSGTVTTGSNPMTIPINSATTETATFAPIPASFTLSATPSASALIGGTAQANLTMTPVNGFSQHVSLSYDPTVWPLTILPTFGSFDLGPGGSTSLSLAVLTLASPGTYVLPIIASGGGVSSSATITLTVTAPAGGLQRRDSGCQAEAYGLSALVIDTSTGTVSGYAYTEVNQCAYYFGYLATTISGLWKGSDSNPVDVEPRGDLVADWYVEEDTSATSTDGDFYTVVTDHFVVLTVVCYVDAYGDVVYGDPLGYSFLSTEDGPTGDSADTYPSDEYGILVYSSTVFLGYTEVSGSASDPTPEIDSITPNFWDPGAYTIVIAGSGFGVSPSLAIEPDDGLARLTVNSVSADGTQINATATVDPGAIPGNRVVTVTSNGTNVGLGFISGPGKSKTSNPANVVIGANRSPCSLTIPSDGQSYAISSADYRTAHVQLQMNSNCNGSVSWTASVFYATSGGKGAGITGPLFATGQLNQTTDLPITGAGGKVVVKGTATVNGVTTTMSATVYVTGTSIPTDYVTGRIHAIAPLYYSGPTPNVLTGIAENESRYQSTPAGQFWNQSTTTGGPLVLFGQPAYWPNESYDGGSHIGLLQVPTSVASAWDMNYNIQSGASILGGFYYYSSSYNTGQVARCRTRGRTLPNLSPLQIERDAVTGYRFGTGTHYYNPGPTCTAWVKNVDNITKYADRAYGSVR